MPRIEPILSKDEIATLLADGARSGPTRARTQAVGIDLLADDRHLRSLVPALQVGFARLAESLRRILTSVLRGYAVLALDPVFTFSVIERLFGGGGGPPQTPSGRSPTSLERRMLVRALGPLFEALNGTLEPPDWFHCSVHGVESRLDLVPGYTPDTTALYVPFTLSIGSQIASFSLAIPAPLLEPLRGRWANTVPEACASTMPTLVREVPVDVSVVLGRATMSLRQLVRLQPGLVLTLEQGRSEELPIEIEGITKWAGHPVQQDGMVAVEITRRIP
jgi:flagellar motor switch protein FliM